MSKKVEIQGVAIYDDGTISHGKKGSRTHYFPEYGDDCHLPSVVVYVKGYKHNPLIMPLREVVRPPWRDRTMIVRAVVIEKGFRNQFEGVSLVWLARAEQVARDNVAGDYLKCSECEQEIFWADGLPRPNFCSVCGIKFED